MNKAAAFLSDLPLHDFVDSDERDKIISNTSRGGVGKGNVYRRERESKVSSVYRRERKAKVSSHSDKGRTMRRRAKKKLHKVFLVVNSISGYQK